MRIFTLRIAVFVLTGLFLATSFSAARSETYTGTNLDSRVIVGLSADSAAVQALLPENWTSVPFPDGPLNGANLLVTFVDGILMVDAEGKPLEPASRRAVILLGLGKDDGGSAVRIFVMRVYTTEPENDPYGVNVAAMITRMYSLTGPAAGGRQSTDAWAMTTSGGELAMTLQYSTGRRSWSPGEALSFSAAKPDFHRIYRYDSITDLVMSTAVGKEINGEFRMKSSVRELEGIFNGREETIAILDIPVRVRKIFLP